MMLKHSISVGVGGTPYWSANYSTPVMSTKTLTINGMHCEHCVASVRDALEALDGVSVENVEIGQAKISVDSVTDDELSAVLDEAGYELVS